ncbi:MAG: DNA primase, partial [Bdellovibrionales bacterium]|nr:DNA primase [Bdellovibrionales bacterium]NQZ19396.1 DNA primase [Bdellovibrionales bacterium]
CPFPDHNEKSPSFSVSEDKQLYHCFGCKKSGNIFTFLETYNGFSFPESVEFLANRASIEMPKPEENKGYQKPRVSKDQKNQFHSANKFAAVFYHQKLKSLPKTHKVHSYLEKRGFTEEIIDAFRIGYAPEPWDDLAKYFQSKKVPVSVGEKLGLLRRNKKGGHFDLFRDRLMFPIFSIDSEVIGFGGRIIDQGQPKYINSVESDVFKKGKTFYGIEQSAKHIRTEDQVFVVEGYMDFIALYSRGVKNVVATLGTALTENHVRLIKRWTKNVVLLFDGDQAGQTAAERSLSNFFLHDLAPQIFVLPDGKDPDDHISEVGDEQFKEDAKSSQDLFLHLLGVWMKDYKSQPKDKIQLMDKVTPLLKGLNDNRLLQIYVEELAQRMSETPQKVFHWIKSGKAAAVQSQQPSEAPKIAVEKKISLADIAKDELVLLGLSLKAPKYLDFLINPQGVESLSHGQVKDVFSQIVAKYGQEPNNFDKLAHLVISKVNDPEKIVSLTNISSPDEDSEKDEIEFKECLIRVKDRKLRRELEAKTTQLKNGTQGDELEQIVNINKSREKLKDIKNAPLGE